MPGALSPDRTAWSQDRIDRPNYCPDIWRGYPKRFGRLPRLFSFGCRWVFKGKDSCCKQYLWSSDNHYTVFGRVTKGLDILDNIAAVEIAAGDRPKKDVKMKVLVIK